MATSSPPADPLETRGGEDEEGDDDMALTPYSQSEDGGDGGGFGFESAADFEEGTSTLLRKQGLPSVGASVSVSESADAFAREFMRAEEEERRRRAIVRTPPGVVEEEGQGSGEEYGGESSGRGERVQQQQRQEKEEEVVVANGTRSSFTVDESFSKIQEEEEEEESDYGEDEEEGGDEDEEEVDGKEGGGEGILDGGTDDELDEPLLPVDGAVVPQEEISPPKNSHRLQQLSLRGSLPPTSQESPPFTARSDPISTARQSETDITAISCSEGMLPHPPPVPLDTLPQIPSVPLHHLTAQQKAAVEEQRVLASDHVRIMNRALAGYIAFDDLIMLQRSDAMKSGNEETVTTASAAASSATKMSHGAEGAVDVADLRRELLRVKSELEQARNEIMLLRRDNVAELMVHQDKVIRDLIFQLANRDAELKRERMLFLMEREKSSSNGSSRGGDENEERGRRLEAFVQLKSDEARSSALEVEEWKRRCLASAKKWGEFDSRRRDLASTFEREMLANSRTFVRMRAALEEKDGVIRGLRNSLGKLASGGVGGVQRSSQAARKRRDAASLLVAEINNGQDEMRRLCNAFAEEVATLRKAARAPLQRDRDGVSREEVESLRGQILELKAQGGVAAVLEAQACLRSMVMTGTLRSNMN